MPTNEERQEIARKLRKLSNDALKEKKKNACELSEAVGEMCYAFCTNYVCWSGTLNHLADLIEPDYTSEESGYFILPKPKAPLVRQYNSVDCSVYEIINENVRKWQRQIEEDIQQRIFETFRKTCTNVGEQMTCSECGAHVYGAIYEHSFVNENGNRVYTTANEPEWNYCPNCGAKVVEK